jgi:hypothetical protein
MNKGDFLAYIYSCLKHSWITLLNLSRTCTFFKKTVYDLNPMIVYYLRISMYNVSNDISAYMKWAIDCNHCVPLDRVAYDYHYNTYGERLMFYEHYGFTDHVLVSNRHGPNCYRIGLNDVQSQNKVHVSLEEFFKPYMDSFK